jgi:hypothetical protein
LWAQTYLDRPRESLDHAVGGRARLHPSVYPTIASAPTGG